jgi:3-deoxy-manno-octulosonate cytidylyltransferase (CMP-KDO synthetase)
VERLEQLRPLAHGLPIGVARVAASLAGIDTEDDLLEANRRWPAFAVAHRLPGPVA